jgi:hypothetical protein
MMQLNFIILLFALLITLVTYFFLAVVVVVVGIGMGERAGPPRLTRLSLFLLTSFFVKDILSDGS